MAALQQTQTAIRKHTMGSAQAESLLTGAASDLGTDSKALLQAQPALATNIGNLDGDLQVELAGLREHNRDIVGEGLARAAAYANLLGC